MDPYSVNKRLNDLAASCKANAAGGLALIEKINELEKKAEVFAEDIQNIYLSLIKEGVDMERVDQLEHDTQKLQESIKELIKLTAEMNTHRNGLTIRIAEVEARLRKLEYTQGDSPL